MLKPLICIPMGDPAGIGPEIVAAAAVSPGILENARLVVVGNEATLRKAARLMRVEPALHRIDESCRDAREGVVNLIHMDNVDLDALRYGEVQAMCGQAAFDYIALSVKLAMDGRVNALATTPINKEALKAASIDCIGHTEILADLSGSNDPLTMFQVHDLRVFFLTRHLSLADACKAVSRERLLSYIKRCIGALRLLGVDEPSLAVAGLNPHCGEHGLFGDEEVREIEPAIAQAQAEGYRVDGPRPADSVFHFALNGAWDAVLSLYHDQGHIATKMVDFERTISLTLGMPFLRTSVDHGTAFDIAGKGQASCVSMVEAVRLATLYAPRFRRNQACTASPAPPPASSTPSTIQQ
jgi:4-hydroxythreonine-4-phosphate dehydrogenase